MALELQSPSPSLIDFDFDFNHGRGSPCLSTPSSPKGFGNGSYFFSTPASPAREFEDFAYPKSPLLHQPPSPAPAKTKPHSKKSSSLWSTFSPRRKKPSSKPETVERGRERSVSRLSTSKSQRVGQARSLSPERRRWRLKDLLLFRSASEGRGTDKDPFKKYNMSSHKNTPTRGSAESSSVVKRGPVLTSAHELHYKANKAISEDMRKKSFLPYKQGILGRLAIYPTVPALGHGFGSLAHNRG